MVRSRGEEWGLKEWAEDLNRRRGLAPSTAAVLQEKERRRARVSAAVQPSAWGTAEGARGRMRATRWRRRWGGRFGSIRKREDVTPEELRAKAGALVE